jgi:hypothetical protein
MAMAIGTTAVRTSPEGWRVAGSPAGIPHALQMIRGAYLEVPALHLTRSQIQRLWRLDVVSCDNVIKALVELRFLEQMQDGGFVRARGPWR